jgi:2-polyprenyl-3-methyl-5-hydroxy-6-metoxy-1,4-benzoquinol methylase
MPSRSEHFDTASVRAEWDAAAEAYAEGQATGHDYYRLDFFGPAHVALCGAVQGLRVLDVGCGAGYFAREMASRGAIVTGIDMSPGMLDHAESFERQAPFGIDYANVDAARLLEHFAPASFDLTTSCLALQDMPDIPKVLRSIHDALVPGGRLVASIPHPAATHRFECGKRTIVALTDGFASTGTSIAGLLNTLGKAGSMNSRRRPTTQRSKIGSVGY